MYMKETLKTKCEGNGDISYLVHASTRKKIIRGKQSPVSAMYARKG